MAPTLSWIAVDWGTSNLRLWALEATGRVIGTRSAPKGMGALRPDQFEPTLLALIDDLMPSDRKTPVLICGMAGARQGWVEAPYVPVPCAPVGGPAVVVPTRDNRLNVRILPGLSQSDPADVMRGEETQIAGVLANEPDFNGAICLPGTHAKWVRVEEGKVTRFRTMMTGELFALLGQQSVLRHAVDDGWNDDAFDEGIAAAVSHPEGLLADLFSIRARSLLSDAEPGAGRARLSGLLIGAELAAARAYWQNGPVIILGDPKVSHLYEAALGWLGGQARAEDATQLTLAGLSAAHRRMEWGTK